jgi:hypothetical protein
MAGRVGRSLWFNTERPWSDMMGSKTRGDWTANCGEAEG